MRPFLRNTVAGATVGRWSARCLTAVVVAGLVGTSGSAAAQVGQAPAEADPRAPVATAVPSRNQSSQPLRVVAIDPGHGGSEAGAIGANTGLTEKEIALDIARRLRDLIQERLGMQVVLTREADVDKTLEQRTALANNFKADVFVSIHVNAYRGRGVRGAETFFLSHDATDDDARRVAALENDAYGLQEAAGGDSELQLLLWDMAQTVHLRESSALAEMIQTRLNRLAGTADRGIKQAPFRVLKGATMPAVLVELGFLSNPDEEALLADPSYRQRLAGALYDSLDAFRQRQELLSGGSR